ncbi:UNVERIFIED_CONTAM: hypothetical protein Sradi_4261200 [Sesamum radiatum]|uniref:C2 NT-type domain-containing protein n=1 Tax=Sesamum radiatum TaxID=300843 RepID=A0AAW2P4W1_SESRA
MSIRGGDGDTFQKNCIEFNLYEPRRDKTVKGQLLGTAVLDFADYGIVKESLSLSAPISCKRTYRNTAQPLLFLKIQSVERIRTSSSSKDSLIREVSMDSNHGESVSALMSEEYAEEAEFTTDDDGSSQSSLAVASLTADSNGSSSPHKEKQINTAEIQQKSNEFGKQAEGTQQNVVNGGRELKVQLSSEEGKLSPPISEKTMAELHHQTERHIDSGFSYLVDDKNASSIGAENLLGWTNNAPPNSSTDEETTENMKSLQKKEES